MIASFSQVCLLPQQQDGLCVPCPPRPDELSLDLAKLKLSLVPVVTVLMATSARI